MSQMMIFIITIGSFALGFYLRNLWDETDFEPIDSPVIKTDEEYDLLLEENKQLHNTIARLTYSLTKEDARSKDEIVRDLREDLLKASKRETNKRIHGH